MESVERAESECNDKVKVHKWHGNDFTIIIALKLAALNVRVSRSTRWES